MDIGAEINVTACIVPVTGQALGNSLIRIRACREILRIDFDIAHRD